MHQYFEDCQNSVSSQIYSTLYTQLVNYLFNTTIPKTSRRKIVHLLAYTDAHTCTFKHIHAHICAYTLLPSVSAVPCPSYSCSPKKKKSVISIIDYSFSLSWSYSAKTTTASSISIFKNKYWVLVFSCGLYWWYLRNH